jgi:hypothetical protein
MSVRRLIVIARESECRTRIHALVADCRCSRENAQDQALEGCQVAVIGSSTGGLSIFPGNFSSTTHMHVLIWAQDYTLSIRWRPAPAQNELLANAQNDSGSYELSFSRLNQTTPWNPHSDLESHFTRRLQDDLAAGDIASFAMLLRDSLPVLLEINRIANHASISARLDIFYKAVGWYRVLIDSR